jgi:ankyrin repeat protein
MGDLEALLEAAKKGQLETAQQVLQSNPGVANQKDESGATALHYAAIHGHRAVVRLLVDAGANINCADDQFGASPAGWAIEYLREMGGFLEIELDDFAFAIRSGDLHWVERFLKRFPSLRNGSDAEGHSFRELARMSGNAKIAALFEE